MYCECLWRSSSSVTARLLLFISLGMLIIFQTFAGSPQGVAQNSTAQVTVKPDDAWSFGGGGSAQVGLCLDNRRNTVGGAQIDICEEIDGNPTDCLSCIGCVLTERSVLFDCFVNELSNGCCRTILISKHPGGVINRGYCSIVGIQYLVGENCLLSRCVMLVPVNIKISDRDGYPLMAEGLAGSLCNFGCGDVYPSESFSGAFDCGNSVIDIFDIIWEVDFALGKKTVDGCQQKRADVPTGTPPYCIPPNEAIDIFDIMVLIDMALNRQDCCSYYYMGLIY